MKLAVAMRCSLVALLVGCAAEMDDDGADDAFLDADGKADTGGITEASPIACGVLNVVNTQTRTVLRTKVGLPTKAVDNILAYRAGDDADSTADDETFDTLAELDRVPYVGPAAFAKLAAYAEDQDFTLNCTVTPPPPTVVDVFSPDSCVGTAVSELPNLPSRTIASTLKQRTRSCTNASCTPWVSKDLRVGQEVYVGTNAIGMGAQDDHTQYYMGLTYFGFQENLQEWVNNVWLTMLVQTGPNLSPDFRPVRLRNFVTDHCARIFSPTLRVGDVTAWDEHEFAIGVAY